MKIENIVKGLFMKIAKRLGLELQEKDDSEINYTENGVNPTAIGATVIANIAIDDSDLIVEGENKRADALRELADYYCDEILFPAAEVALGTGDCIVRPFTDGQYIGLNIIGNDNFVITESIGTHLKGVIIKLDERETDKFTYRLFESQTLKETEGKKIVYIRRFAYKDDNEVELSNTVWKDLISEEVIIAEQLILGRIKCPTLNRDNYNSANGVPITFGCEDIVSNVRKKYNQYNEEFDRKQALIFADRTMFKKEKDEDGVSKYKLEGTHFVKIRGDMDGKVSEMIKDYSPAIREAEFKNALDLNLSVLELCCGFSRGVFTTPETAFATATEMKNSLKKTFAFVKRFRKRIEAGNEMLFKAINIIMNLNSITPMGDYELRHDWSYDYIEETKERFNQLLQGHNEGVVKDETLCAWINGLTEEEAQKYMAELAAAAAETTESDDDNNDDGMSDFVES